MKQLEFKQNELSGQLYAKSRKDELKTYWIQEKAWVYLSVSRVTKNGPQVDYLGHFVTLEDAKNEAQRLEDNAAESIK